MRFLIYSCAISTVATSAASTIMREDYSHDGIYVANGKVADLASFDFTPVTHSGEIISRRDYDGVYCDNDSHGSVGFNPTLAEQAVNSLRNCMCRNIEL